MPDTAGKRHERVIAARLGTKRIGPTGKHGPDLRTDELSVECKERKETVKWMEEGLDQAEVDAGDRLPVMIVHRLGSRHETDWVIVRLRYLSRLLSTVKENE